MAIELERLVATLEANMKTYDKAMKKALGDTDRTFGRIESRGRQLESRLSKLGHAAFGGFARGAASVLTPTLLAAAAIGKTKQALQDFGDVADNAMAAALDPELFQSLQHQAELSGVALEASAGALATFAKNSALAVEGKGKMVAQLKVLNPALLENIRAARSQEERVRLVADALASEANQAKRAAIATAAFGEAGGKLAGAFAGGSAAIDETMQKAKQLGLIVDRDIIARADQLGDEFDTTTKIVDVQLKQAMVNLGPTLVWLTGLAGNFAEQIGRSVEGFQALDQRSSSTLEARLAGIDKQLQANDPYENPNLGQAAGIDPAAAAAERAAIMAELRRRALANLSVQLSAPKAPVTDTLDDIETRNDAAEAAIKQAEAVKELISGLEFEGELLGQSAIDQEVARNLRQAGAAATQEQRRQIEEKVRANFAEQQQLEALQDVYEELGNIGEAAVNKIVDAMADGKVEGEELLAIAGDIASQLGGMFISNAFSGFGKGGGGFDLSKLFSFDGGGSTGRGARSGGVDGKGGFPAIVHPNETVIDHTRGQTQAAGGGGDTYYIDARGAQLGVGAEIARQLEDFSRFRLPGRVKQISADPHAVG